MNIFMQIAEAVKRLFSKEIRDKVGVDIAVSRSMSEKISCGRTATKTGRNGLRTSIVDGICPPLSQRKWLGS